MKRFVKISAVALFACVLVGLAVLCALAFTSSGNSKGRKLRCVRNSDCGKDANVVCGKSGRCEPAAVAPFLACPAQLDPRCVDVGGTCSWDADAQAFTCLCPNSGSAQPIGDTPACGPCTLKLQDAYVDAGGLAEDVRRVNGVVVCDRQSRSWTWPGKANDASQNSMPVYTSNPASSRTAWACFNPADRSILNCTDGQTCVSGSCVYTDPAARKAVGWGYNVLFGVVVVVGAIFVVAAVVLFRRRGGDWQGHSDAETEEKDASKVGSFSLVSDKKSEQNRKVWIGHVDYGDGVKHTVVVIQITLDEERRRLILQEDAKKGTAKRCMGVSGLSIMPFAASPSSYSLFVPNHVKFCFVDQSNPNYQSPVTKNTLKSKADIDIPSLVGNLEPNQCVVVLGSRQTRWFCLSKNKFNRETAVPKKTSVNIGDTTHQIFQDATCYLRGNRADDKDDLILPLVLSVFADKIVAHVTSGENCSVFGCPGVLQNKFEDFWIQWLASETAGKPFLYFPETDVVAWYAAARVFECLKEITIQGARRAKTTAGWPTQLLEHQTKVSKLVESNKALQINESTRGLYSDTFLLDVPLASDIVRAYIKDTKLEQRNKDRHSNVKKFLDYQHVNGMRKKIRVSRYHHAFDVLKETNTTFDKDSVQIVDDPGQNPIFSTLDVVKRHRTRMTIVDFSNRHIGGLFNGHGNTQEELLFEDMPHLLCACALLKYMFDKDTCIVENPIYQTKDTNETKQDIRYVVMIDALGFNEGEVSNNPCEKWYKIPKNDEFDPRHVRRELHKLCVAYKHATQFVTVGNWGSGVFGGNRCFKWALQFMALSVTKKIGIALPFDPMDSDYMAKVKDHMGNRQPTSSSGTESRVSLGTLLDVKSNGALLKWFQDTEQERKEEERKNKSETHHMSDID